jgi:hypothetical protein
VDIRGAEVLRDHLLYSLEDSLTGEAVYDASLNRMMNQTLICSHHVLTVDFVEGVPVRILADLED